MVKNVWGLHLTKTLISLTRTTSVRARPKQGEPHQVKESPNVGGSTKSYPCNPRTAAGGGPAPSPARRPCGVPSRGLALLRAPPAPSGALRRSAGEGRGTFHPPGRPRKHPGKPRLSLLSGSWHQRSRSSKGVHRGLWEHPEQGSARPGLPDGCPLPAVPPSPPPSPTHPRVASCPPGTKPAGPRLLSPRRVGEV